MTTFDAAALDLDAYLERIEYGGSTTADLKTLASIAARHPAAIAFENLNPILGRPVPLDIAALQQKFLREGRGGWCFEHNLLLGTALRALGFAVTGLAARVRWNVAPGVVRPRSHMVLHLEIGGRAYIADAGFGGLTLTAPLRLEIGVEQETPHETFRLTRDEAHYVVEARVAGEWRALYAFDLQPQALADYEVASWYLANHPQSHFVTTLIAARARPDCRYALQNTALTIYHRDGFTERRMMVSAGQIRSALEQMFGITVPADTHVDAMFAGLVERSALA